ncbi:hypothetical protein KJ781_01230, partial [Patescibacteria group bacterium]|nr:hypothetical protein [Patescibacteria group bacterium]MBU1448972.1 hypothetical protein [Patescibacteria group bacterium]
MSDRKRIDRDVVDFEPHDALFAGRDGLALIESFLQQLASFDVRFTSAFLEFDPPQTAKLRRLARSSFPRADIIVHKDLAKRNRVLEISTDVIRPS